MTKYEEELRYVSQLGLAISDGNRLRMLMALEGRTLCVCQMTELLGLAPSTVSKHLSILKQAGLVKEKKEGRWVYHELCCGNCTCFPLLEWVLRRLSRDEQVAQDRVRLKQILQMSAEELCRK